MTVAAPDTCGSKSGGPQDNPIADTMVNWSSVYNVKDYGGSFDSAQKAAVSGGGGVVYFPAGTYSWDLLFLC